MKLTNMLYNMFVKLLLTLYCEALPITEKCGEKKINPLSKPTRFELRPPLGSKRKQCSNSLVIICMDS